MNAASLGQRQLFGIKKDNLLKRISTYFEETNNAGEVVEYFVAVLVRHALSVGDYSINELSDLIRSIFLTSEPTDTLRQHCVYFQDYFPDEKDWKTVIQRLFASEAAFRDYTREASAYKALLDEKNREVPVLSDYQFNLVSVFKDVTGKRHTWALQNIKKVQSTEQTRGILKILTTLTIFKTAGVRRFAEYVRYKSVKGRVDAEDVEPVVTIKEEQTPAAKTPEKPKRSAAQKQAVAASTGKNTAALICEEKVEQTSTALPDEASLDTTNISAAPPSSSKKRGTSEKAPSSTKYVPESLQKPDTSYMKIGKTKEQIQEAREERKRQRKIKKALNKRKRR